MTIKRVRFSRWKKASRIKTFNYDMCYHINPIKWIYPAVVLIISIALWLLGRYNHDFAEFWSLNVYPIFAGTIARIFGWIPFSVSEFLLYGLILLVIGGVVYHIVRITKVKKGKLSVLIDLLRRGISIAVTIFFLLTANCLIGYNRSYYTEYSGLTVTTYTKEQLLNLTEAMIARANYFSERIETDENNISVCNVDMQSESVNVMEKLAAKNEVLRSFAVKPKPVAASRIMSYCNLCGIYSPFTVEANYNDDMPNSKKPFTICHELSHLTGFIREDEANYIAFMACRQSDSDFFNYSGYLDGLVYCLNAYNSVASAEEYSALYAKINYQIMCELRDRNQYWSQFETPIAAAASSINDAYLKSNQQEDGEKSYGRVVDLMLAEYISNGII